MARIRLAGVLAVVAAVAFLCMGMSGGQGRAADSPATRPASAEKLIMGFEKAEIENKKQGRACWTFIEKADDGYDFWTPFEYGEVGSRAWTWRCRPGQVTEGKLALATRIGPGGRGGPKFQSTPIIDRYYPMLRNGETPIVMNTFGFLAQSGLGIGDWAGYDVLRVDLRAEGAAKIWLCVEDDLIEPPVVCEYDAPAGKWVTLEMDLRAAVKERGLDLAKIANFWILGRPTQTTDIRVDNIRVAVADSPAALEVLRDERSMKLPAIDQPAKPVVPALPADVKPNRAAVKLGEPIIVPRATMAPFGWIAAYDNDRLLLGHNLNGKPGVSFTKDGGATWESLAAPAVANLDHGTARGSVVDETGDVITVSSGLGCAGVGVASPRQFLSKYTFTGKAWELRTPPAILDCDIRHCGSTDYVVRLREGKHAGRLWAVWGEIDRFRTLCAHAKYSDDDGATWQVLGKGALVPGSRESHFNYNTYGYQQPRCAPYGDGIAVFWQDARGLMWNRMEGDQWATAEVIDATAAPILAPTENESFRVPGSCVTRGTSEVFLTAWKVPGVLRWDGSKWQRECADATDAGVLTLCGGKQLMLFTAGSTEQPPPRRRVTLMKESSVLCYQRKADGSWAKPLDLSGGPVNILEYRQITALAAPQYSPPNFAPVAWSDKSSVKIVKVPVQPD
ncbi:MAG: sialidase family protein [Phycisphaerae bacterium]